MSRRCFSCGNMLPSTTLNAVCDGCRQIEAIQKANQQQLTYVPPGSSVPYDDSGEKIYVVGIIVTFFFFFLSGQSLLMSIFYGLIWPVFAFGLFVRFLISLFA